MVPSQLSNYALFFFSCTFVLNFLTIPIPVSALNIGVETTGITVSVSKQCSRKCESSFCSDDYLSQECSQTFINCMQKFKNSGAPTFKGNTCQVDDVIEVINVVMEAALLAGRVLHKP
ncbi:Phospholipase A2-alpha [Spatholobus suberectus]|nr:Phospholipase A2-alpha [Spatholobus suberectus]